MRRRRLRAPRSGLVRIPGHHQYAMPAKLQTQMHFSKLTNHTAASAFLRVQLIEINNMHDSFITSGTTDQPMLFDQMMALYQRYYVRACRVRITITNNDPDDGVAVFGFVNTASSGSTSYNRAKDQPRAFQTVLGSAIGSASVKALNLYYDIKEHSSAQDKDDLSGTVTSGPVDNVFLQLYVQNMSATAFHDISIVWSLTFYSEFYGIIVWPES